MASTHPNSMNRWEDSASLEHACWACPTKANSPRALQTCYGVHSMPCVSYHPTMHALGAAHRCSGCITARETHDARHRNVRQDKTIQEPEYKADVNVKIAELLVEYRVLDSPLCVPETPTRRGPLVEVDANIAGVQRNGQDTTATVRRDRNHVQGLGIAIHEDVADITDAAAVEVREEAYDDDDSDGDDAASMSSYAPSSTATTSDQATNNKKPTKAEIRAQKKSKKCARSTSKALKNKNRNLATVTSPDVERIARILHGDEQDSTSNGSAHPLATDKNIEEVMFRNLGFCNNITAHKTFLHNSINEGRRDAKEKNRLKKRESRGERGEVTIEMEEVVSAIMIKLGVDPVVVAASLNAAGGLPGGSTPSKSTPKGFSSGRNRAASNLSFRPATISSGSGGKGSCGGNSKACVHIAVKLRAAIKSDLEKHENEVHARYVRAGSFWRYVGKVVFERMTGFARKTDVATGESWEKKWAREGKGGLNDHVEEEPHERDD